MHSAESTYVFRHAVLRDTVYQLQMPGDRAELHCAAFHILDRVLPADRRQWAAGMAFHAGLGTEVEPTLEAQQCLYLKLAADFARDHFDNVEAIDLYLQLARFQPEAANARLEAAAIAMKIGRVDQAADLAAAVEGDSAARVRATLVLAEVALTRGDYPGALSQLQAAESLAIEGAHIQLQHEVRIHEIGVYARQGLMDECQQACEALQNAPDVASETLARVASHLGWVNMQRGELDTSLAWYEEGERRMRALNNSRGMYAAVGNKGHVLRRMGRNQEGLACYLETVAEARRTGDQRMLMIGLGNIGNAHNQIKQQEVALEYLRQAEAMAREIGDRHAIAMNVGSRGNVFFELKRYEEALECFTQAEQAQRRLGARQGTFVNLSNRGSTLAALRRDEEAVVVLREALDSLESAGFRWGANELFLHDDLASVHARLGDHENAAQVATRGLEKALAIGLDQRNDADIAQALANTRRLAAGDFQAPKD